MCQTPSGSGDRSERPATRPPRRRDCEIEDGRGHCVEQTGVLVEVARDVQYKESYASLGLFLFLLNGDTVTSSR